jgi:hypothetical protein
LELSFSTTYLPYMTYVSKLQYHSIYLTGRRPVGSHTLTQFQ